MELGPHKDRGKLWPGWDLNSRPSGLITTAPPTETQGQTGAGRGNWRCQFHGNEYVQLSTRKGYVFVANVCRVALIVWTNSMTSSQGFIRPRNQPRSQGLSSPHPKGSEGGKSLVQAGHMSWRQIYLHGRGSNLSKYCRRFCLLPPKPALWHGQLWKAESSLSISQRRFVISSTLLSTFETKLGLETMKR